MPDQRDTFNSVAAEYEAVRPTYPTELYDDLASVAGGVGERVLEVGCGSGQATRGFLDRGWQVVAVDPGDELVALAKANLTGGVSFHVSPFETFEAELGAFGLVASAQAWHWIDPTLSFPRAAQALRARGVLAVFGHVPMSPPADILQRLEPIYQDIAPDLRRPPPQAWYLPGGPVRELFDASGLFGPVTHRAFTWTEQVTPAAFVRQLRTRSDYNMVEAVRRDRLLAEVEKALRPLGALSLAHETHLYRAVVKS